MALVIDHVPAVIQDLFEGVLGADFMGEFAKPDAEAFQKVCCS